MEKTHPLSHSPMRGKPGKLSVSGVGLSPSGTQDCWDVVNVAPTLANLAPAGRVPSTIQVPGETEIETVWAVSS